MRLSGVRISGFKSFADGANLKLSAGRIAVVGPNGCGKSNIIDALRWAMGESRASALRGESLQDVLFNGAASRPAADWCEVELRLINDGKRDLGMWSRYPQIAVKRELRRDGQSSYFINGQAVRRRDVADLFRGTGVGARAYGVVEQGMISRIVESNPQELRAHLEEAAGVSQYKERRRDSERRLANSRENLARLEDSASELEKRIAALKRQSGAAERYAKLNAQITEKRALLLSIRRESAAEKLTSAKKSVRELGEKIAAHRRHADELRRERQAARTRLANLTRAAEESRENLHSARARVSEITQRIAHLSESRRRVESQSASREAEIAAAADSLKKLADEKAEWELKLIESRRELKSAEAAAADNASALSAAEELNQKAAREFDSARESLFESRRALESEIARAELSSTESAESAAQIARAEAALAELKNEENESAHSQAARIAEEAAESLAQSESAVAEKTAAVAASDEVLESKTAAHRRTEAAALALRAEKDALLRVGGADDSRLSALASASPLKNSADDSKPTRLAALMRIQNREWERALDGALGRRAAAFVIESVDAVAAAAQKNQAPPGVVFVENPPDESPNQNADSGDAKFPTLLAKIGAPPHWRNSLSRWLAGVYAADDDESALAIRRRLGEGEAVVTKSGNYYAADSAHFHGDVVGGLEWQSRLRALGESLSAKEKELIQSRESLAEAKAKSELARENLRAAESARDAARKILHECEIAASKSAERREWAAARRESAARSLADLRTSRARLEESRLAAEKKSAELKAEESRLADALKQAEKARELAAESLSQKREAAQESAAHQQQFAFAESRARERLERLNAEMESLGERRGRLQKEASELKDELSAMSEETLSQSQKEAEESRAAAEEKSARDKIAQEKATAENDELERRRAQTATTIESAQEEAGTRRLAEQSLESEAARLDDAMEELNIAESRIAELRAESPKMPESDLDADVENLTRRREKLGAINFAAAAELESDSAKRDFLRAQMEDVSAAATELERAIRRLDRETEERLTAVRTRLDEKFGEFFARMFGGGRGSIEAVGETAESAGFQIRAQPPGKRVQNISALSGGEKSLAAAAFLFALFALNPAPFCLLDEVDAALDESNTLRFCELLRQVAADTQCLFVTHNKTTVESAVAEQLIGVTQTERGVSRLVTVNVGEAAKMIEQDRKSASDRKSPSDRKPSSQTESTAE